MRLPRREAKNPNFEISNYLYDCLVVTLVSRYDCLVVAVVFAIIFVVAVLYVIFTVVILTQSCLLQACDYYLSGRELYTLQSL